MNIECNSNFNNVGFKANYAKVLRTPKSDLIIACAAKKKSKMRVVIGEEVTDILFYNPKTRFRILENLKKIGATMICPERNISEPGFRSRICAGNTFEQKV